MKGLRSFEPNCGLSCQRNLMSCLFCIVTSKSHLRLTGLLAVVERRRKTVLARMRAFWPEVKEQTDVVGQKPYKIPLPLINCLVSHVSGKYLINSWIVVFVAVGFW